MTHYGTWVSYSGDARIGLAVAILAAAAGIAYAGTRLRRSVTLPRPGKTAAILMVAAWVFSLGAFAAGLSVYIHQLFLDHLVKAPPSDPITPVTVAAAVATFFVVLMAAAQQPGVRLASAAIGAMAAPMILELPFDLIVMTRTYPPIAPDPALYRLWFFVPLFLIELTTLSLLTLSPMVKLSKPALFFFALMLAIFAIWVLFGFGYPSAPLPIAFNVLSKIVAFATALSLFIPHWFSFRRRSEEPEGGLERRQPDTRVPARAWSGLFDDAIVD